MADIPAGHKLTPEFIENVIVDEYYFTAGEGLEGALVKSMEGAGRIAAMHANPALDYVTICVMVLANGFTVVGVNHGPADPANFDAELGKDYARRNAVDQIWPLEGYLLKQMLAEKAHATE